jgi:hypothetical protein
MSKNRYINTKFWDDNYILELDPTEKLLFLYCLTNPLTSICGIYEISIKRIAFDTGIDKDMLIKLFDRFTKDNKIKYANGWIGIKNFIKHQKQSENPKDKINIGIKIALEKSPERIKAWVFDEEIEDNNTLEDPSKPLNYSNININSNINSNSKENKAKAFPHKQYTDIYNKKLLSLGYKQDEINKSVFKEAKQRKQLSNLIKRFETPVEFGAFLDKAVSDKWIVDKGFTPSLLNSQYSTIMMKKVSGAPSGKYNDEDFEVVL